MTRRLLAAAVLCFLPVFAEAQYQITVLKPDFQGKKDALRFCSASGINDAGDIVGLCSFNADTNSGPQHAWIFDGRRYREFDFERVRVSLSEIDEAAVESYREVGLLKKNKKFISSPVVGENNLVPQDINRYGEVTGWYLGKGGYPLPNRGGLHGFLKTKHKVFDLTVPGSVLTEATGINDAGQVVGDYRVAIGGVFPAVFRIFVYTDGVFETFGPDDAGASDINNVGQIVGCFDLCSRGFLYSGGVFTPLDFPGAVATQVRGINDHGQIVGVFSVDNETVRPFIYVNGVFTPLDLGIPDVVTADADGINNFGEIVGSFVTEISPGVFERQPYVAKP